MSDCLIEFDKLPGINLVGVRETWSQIFTKFMLKFTEPDAIHAYKNDQICMGLKLGINGSVHGVQYSWDANSTKEILGFLLVCENNAFNEMNQIEMLWTVLHLWMSGARFVLNCYRHHSSLVL